jgi:PD-(D/E)XK nuclease superfamily
MKKPWSYSRIKAFETCPMQFYYLKVLRAYDEPETDAMRYGTAFHEAAENYIRDGVPLPEGFLFAKAALDALNKFKGEKLCELKMGVTADLIACDFDAEDVWFRGISDLTIVNRERGTAKSIDYKTGKNARYADPGQLELMALATFAHFPEVEETKSALMFVIANAFIPSVYVRDDIPVLWEKWLTKYEAMRRAYEMDVWNPRPSGLCKAHCKVLECAHNGRN